MTASRVADRENRRIQVFDAQGRFLKQWGGLSYPQGLYLTDDESLYVGDTSHVVKMDLSGRITGTFGQPGKAAGEVMSIHVVAVGRGGELFTAELLTWRARKFILVPR